jgi:two-component system cell cycle sensor histidine kinase/response regulator CckA
MQFALTGKATGATTILVVDDDEDFREVIAAILEKAGYDVLEAPNGAEAAAILDRRPGAVDLLITDIQMPKMTGAQLIECVRCHSLTIESRII